MHGDQSFDYKSSNAPMCWASLCAIKPGGEQKFTLDEPEIADECLQICITHASLLEGERRKRRRKRHQ
eukprot:1947852-Pleurochrysis_carterae.AAC.1